MAIFSQKEKEKQIQRKKNIISKYFSAYPRVIMVMDNLHFPDSEVMKV